MKKFFITTSIAYTNAPPHIGFALELIQADVLARYHRILGEQVFYLTGTDEHGQKVAKAAEEEGKTPKEFTDELSAEFKQLTKVLNISNNDFIRTTDKKRHWPVVQQVWLRLKKNNDIYKKKYQGFYCAGCEAFITKKDLVFGKCAVHQKTPEIIEEENYFFKLSKYSKQLSEIIKKGKVKIVPKERKNEILSFIKQGLEDISFSRPRKDLKWGVPVPNDASQSVYVWSEALLNYVSALGYPTSKDFKKFWPADIQCIGKDILRFHSVIWPAMLLSLKLPLPKIIFVHGFITADGQKMSKSLGNVIDPFELVKKYGSASSPRVGVDAVRYFLLREILASDDGDFTYEKFEARYNADLAKGLGNLVARVITLAAKLKTKNEKLKTTTKNLKLKKIIKKTWGNYHKALDDFKFNEALISIWQLIGFCDKIIDKERPWEKKTNQKEIIDSLLLNLKEIARLLQPFLPETSEKILEQLKTQKSQSLFPRLDINRLI